MALLALSLAAVLFASGGRAQAAELLMFEEAGCVWCQRWHAEIGPAYPLSPEGKRAPLRRVPIHEQKTAGVLLDRPVTATPTFVLVRDGREIGRIIGYPGNAFFYGLLGDLMRRLPKGEARGPGSHPAAGLRAGMFRTWYIPGRNHVRFL